MKKLLTTGALILVLAAAQGVQAEGDKEGGFHKGRHHREEILSKLPEEKRELFHATMKTTREQNKESREKLRALREESKAILTAGEFDRKAFLAKSDEIHALHDTMRKNMNNAIADIAEKFTAEERKILAEALPKGPKHGRYKSQDKHEGDGTE